MKAKLKPCPFCGERSQLIFMVSLDGYYYWITCGQCHAEGPPERTRVTRDKAWNRRAKEA